MAVTSLPPRPGNAVGWRWLPGERPDFDIVSVNAAEEIPALAGRFPDVAFVAARETAKADYGRACPAWANCSLRRAAACAPAVAVLNADVVLAAGRISPPGGHGRARGIGCRCRVDVGPDAPGQPGPSFFLL